ncbi:MAG TPA: DUF58 domain-containing protein [Motilibacteraceae bacterium]|nr:DUF58 domain-containing protein [Motilibacteraceae bacterium]
MALTGRAGLLALAGVLVVGLVAPSWWGVLAVSLVVLALAALDLALAGSVRALRVTRHGTSNVRTGEPCEVVVMVHNPGPRRVRGVLRDAWPPSAGAEGQRHDVDVPPGERRRVVTALRPSRRGDRPAGPVTVRAVGPLGLAARQGSHRAPWTVRALPPFTARRHLPARLARLRELDGRAAVRTRGQGTEFDALRDYVAGDDVRSIDWRATARRGGVVVRTWRPERDRHVLVVLDTSRTAAGRVGDAPRLDAAMDAALLLAALATRAGDRVDLLAFDRRVRARVEGASAADVLPSFVQAMAPLEAELVEADMRALVSTVLARTSRRSLVVLLTGLDPAPLEEGLLPVLGQLVRRHQLLVAGVADPRVAELAAGRGTAAAVHGAAAAERELTRRALVAAELARHGVEVVDALPEDLAPALADRYLDLKAAGRL